MPEVKVVCLVRNDMVECAGGKLSHKTRLGEDEDQ